MKRKFEKEEEKNKQKLEKLENEDKKTNETKKTFLKKVKLFFSSLTTKKKEDIQKLKKVNHTVKRSESEIQKPVKPNKAAERTDLTNIPQKAKNGKFKLFFTTKKQNRDNFIFKKFEDGSKRFEDEIEMPVKSLRHYIKQKYKWVISLLIIYIIILGVVISAPIIVNHFIVASQNQTEQGRSKKFNRFVELSGFIIQNNCISFTKFM